MAIAQVGGPTAVINASLSGFLEAFHDHPEFQVFGIIGGMSGLLKEQFFLMHHVSRAQYPELRNTPGAALEAGRKRLSDEHFERIIHVLRKHEIRCLVLAGGNGTMWTCRRIADCAAELGYELQVIGIPKTVDNDLFGTDHSPGYGSAARFVAHAVRDLSYDLAAMRNFEAIRVVETMGRNVGWLAASAGLLHELADVPLFIYVPELPFHSENMLQAVSQANSRHGMAMVVVSEGIKDEFGRPLQMTELDRSGRRVLGGAGQRIAAQIREELNCPCRYENLGMLQRCAGAYVSERDRKDAVRVGRRAGEAIIAGDSGVMMTLERSDDPALPGKVGQVPLSEVAGRERGIDSHWLTGENGHPVNGQFYAWLRPLIGSTEPYFRLYV